jgi:hypothetical protein
LLLILVLRLSRLCFDDAANNPEGRQHDDNQHVHPASNVLVSGDNYLC